MKPETRTTLLAAAAGAAGLLAATLWSNRRGSYSLRGRVVLITGGSRGLGLILARQAVAEGARVAICARDEQDLERARQELAAEGGQVLALAHDLRQPIEVRAMVEEVQRKLGPVDVLVNNAGLISVGALDHMELRDYEESLGVHFWAPLHAMQAVLPQMRRRGEGRIVNIASVGGKVAVPHLVPYSAGKFALVGLSEGFRAELLQYGIQVTTVCPGLMRTGSPRNATIKGRHEQEYAWFSIADSLPAISMDAERAGREIWNACRRGDAEVILGLPAKLLVAGPRPAARHHRRRAQLAQPRPARPYRRSQRQRAALRLPERVGAGALRAHHPHPESRRREQPAVTGCLLMLNVILLTQERHAELAEASLPPK